MERYSRFTADRLPKAADASLVKHENGKEVFVVTVFQLGLSTSSPPPPPPLLFPHAS